MTAPKHRAVLIVAFALLFLGMQREAQVHSLQHLGGILNPAHQHSIQVPVADVTCLGCSLLAGSSSVIAPDLPAIPPAAVATLRIGSPVASRSLPAPSYYSSRAPPSLL